MSMVSFRLATPLNPGAVAIVDLFGEVETILRELTGRNHWRIGQPALVRLGEIDDAVVVRLNDTRAQLMPHGGIRVWQRLRDELVRLGAEPVSDPDPTEAYPEAKTRDEALMLTALAHASSPLALDLLLDQPKRWARYRQETNEPIEEIRRRAAVLNRLLVPPRVVLVGRPNAGKSTLTNTLLGRSAAIASETAGTTRDYIGVSIDLGGLVVHWFDTPGHRETDDPIEQEAIRLAGRMARQADLLIAAAEPGGDWPDLDRPTDLRILLKSDLGGGPGGGGVGGGGLDPAPDLALSAQTGGGIVDFVARIRDTLVSGPDFAHPGPWLFDERLLKSD